MSAKLTSSFIGKWATVFKAGHSTPFHSGIVVADSDIMLKVSNEKNKGNEPLCIEWFAKSSKEIKTRVY